MAGWFALACTTPAAKSAGEASPIMGQSAPEDRGQLFGFKWYEGSVDQAMDAARDAGKPIFLYWGAVWCPPCNELKSQVFSHRKFPELMRQVVPVYLDGDSEAAQLWADKLKVSGYPTLLVLNSRGQEIVRIAESVNFAEFKEAFEAALSANEPLDRVIQQALEGKASDAQWQILAYFNWDASAALKSSPLQMVAVRQKLVDLVPERLVEERALLAARLVESAVAVAGDAKAEEKIVQAAEGVRSQGDRYLDLIFASPATRVAARAFINYSAEDVIRWLYPDRDDKKGAERLTQWVEAARQLRYRGDLSYDTRLWTFQPEIDAHQLRSPTADLPSSLVNEVRQLVEQGDKNSRTSFERHAFISGAAEMLRLVGDAKAAKDLLLREVATTDTPWYYLSALSALSEKLGNKEEALQYSEQARKASKGAATKVQWTTSDLLLNMRIESPEQEQRVAGILAEYYDTVFSLTDGFLGRNGARADRVVKEVGRWSQRPRIRSIIAKYSRQCRQTDTVSQDACRKHFAAYQSKN